MIAAAEVSETVRKLAEFQLHGPQIVDDAFVEQVRLAHFWATTRPGRWRLLTRGSVYGLRHKAAYEMDRELSDKAFGVAVVLAGWTLHRHWLQPTCIKLRRAKAEA